MKRIIQGKVYNTETAELLLNRGWKTFHPNQGGGSPHLEHIRSIYKTKNGTLFGYQYDDIGYGRDRNGVTGMYTREEEELFLFLTERQAVDWAEEWNFDATEVEKVFEVEEG
jgi:hypothetical protein